MPKPIDPKGHTLMSNEAWGVIINTLLTMAVKLRGSRPITNAEMLERVEYAIKLMLPDMPLITLDE
jgi:hypothetical protein